MATPVAAEHRDLEQRLKNMQRQLDRLSSQVLKQRKLEVTSGDFVVSGGGSVTVSGGGSVTVDGTELAAVTAAIAKDSMVNVGMSTTDAVKMTADLTVPPGYTRALVLAVGFVSANNSSGSSNYLRGHIEIGGVSVGNEASSMLAVSGANGTISPTASSLITGLSIAGATISVALFAHSQNSGWGSSNFGNLDAMGVFLR